MNTLQRTQAHVEFQREHTSSTFLSRPTAAAFPFTTQHILIRIPHTSLISIMKGGE